MTFIINSPKYGKHTVEIDNEDAEKVLKYTWHVLYRHRDGLTTLQNVRARVKETGKYKTLFLHRLIMPDCAMIDHIDLNPLNNKKSNLRPCSESENMQNRRAYRNNKLNCKGVCFYNKIKKYRSQINHKGKHICIGDFNTKEEAAIAYNKKARELFGELARLNEIQGTSV